MLLNALGDDSAAEILGQPQHGFHRLDLAAVAMDVVAKISVDLDELGLDLGPQPQARTAVAEIIQCQSYANVAQHAHGCDHAGMVDDALVLRDFDDELSSGHLALLQDPQKLLEASGITVETLDLSEVLGRIGRLKDSDDVVAQKLATIEKYVSTNDVPQLALMKMAKLGAVVADWLG